MILKQKISLVMPCKNEEKSIAKMIKQTPKFVDEIIVVDNNSSDNTAIVAKKHGAKVVTEKRVDERGIGYGFAHQSGMKKASGDVIVTMDGDGTYPIEQIREAVEFLLNENLDFVTCSRFPLKKTTAISPIRKLGVWILNTEVRLAYGYRMQDILSGMWVVRKAVTSTLGVREGGWDLSPEIKLSALMNPKIRFGQYHIDHHHRDNGASKQKLFQTGFNHLKYILVRRATKDSVVYQKIGKLTKLLKSWYRVQLVPRLSAKVTDF